MSDSKAVFLSYASDDAAAAQRIANSLREAKVTVWFDKDELRGGDAWDASIRRQIRDCALFVPIISASTEAREEGYFRREWNLAADRTLDMAQSRTFIVPVLIDDIHQKEAKVPDKFQGVQWTKLPEGNATSAFVLHVQRLLGVDAQVQPPSKTASPGVRTAIYAVRRKSLLLYVGVGLVFMTIAGGGWYFLQGKQAEISSAATATEKTIAVLPFVDMSENKDQEYFADGVAEEIIDLLTRVPGVKVIGRTSSFQFKSKAEDLRNIGARLGANYVVEGSVRRANDRVRVSAQLIGTGDGVQRWSETYDRPVHDVLKLQDDISSDLVRVLQLSVGTDGLRSRAALKNIEAYNLFLRGLHVIDQSDAAAFETSAKYLQQAIAIDPTFAPAIAELAHVRDSQAEFGYVDTKIGYEEARMLAESALKLDPTLPLPHCILGNYHAQYEWDWKSADLEFKRALALDPNDAMTLWMNARFAVEIGNWPEAEQFINASLAIDPLNPVAHYIAGNIWYRMGRLSDSTIEFHRILEISPTYISVHFNLGKAELQLGHLDAALAAMNGESTEPSAGRAAGLAMVYHAMGRTKEANAALMQLIKESSNDWPYGIAQVYASWQDADETLNWLERAYAIRDELHFLNGDPLFLFLQGNLRFKSFRQKLNLPQ